MRGPILAGAGLLLSASLAMAAGAQSPKTFIKNAIEGDNGEIQIGQLVQQKGGSQAVRQFGDMLATDHTKAKQQAEAVAGQLGVEPPGGLKAEVQKEMQKLQGLSGAAFDKEVARYSVKDHEKDIATFRAQAKSGNGPASQLAEKQLPVLEKHLKAARALPSK